MTRHAGVSILLSVLIVVFFAVVLYQPEHASRAAVSNKPATPKTRPTPSTAQATPSPTPGIPLVDPPVASRPATVAKPAATVPTAPARVATTGNRGPVRISRKTSFTAATGSANPDRKPAVAPTPPRVRTQKPPAPRSAFTHAEQGETLADVAVRVYGNSDSARSLWMVNRDVIDGPEAVLVAGTLLRTP